VPRSGRNLQPLCQMFDSSKLQAAFDVKSP
jgi:hypothetical protein